MMPGHSSDYTSEEFKHICSITTVRCVPEDMSECMLGSGSENLRIYVIQMSEYVQFLSEHMSE